MSMTPRCRRRPRDERGRATTSRHARHGLEVVVHLPALVDDLTGLQLPAFVEALATLGLGLVLLCLVAVATRHELFLRQLELTLRELLLVPFGACRRIGGSRGGGEVREISVVAFDNDGWIFSETIRGFRRGRTAILARERAVARDAGVRLFGGLGHRHGGVENASAYVREPRAKNQCDPRSLVTWR